MASTEDLWTGGLLRFPRFLKLVISTIKSEQIYRSEPSPSLLSPEIRPFDLQVSLLICILIFGSRVYGERVLLPKIFGKFPKRVQKKLGENLFYSTYYIFALAYFAAFVCPQADWSMNLLDGRTDLVSSLMYPYPPPMTNAERMYYSQAWGFYCSAMLFLVLHDTRRSDFWELVLHHVVTVGMVGMSYIYGHVRAGILILAMHDVGDIFLYSAKFLHHLGWKGWDTAVFAIFAITFYVTRLVLYSRLVHTVSVETLRRLVKEPGFNRWAMYYDTYLVQWAFFVFCLVTLLFLHCFWFTLILKMVYREVWIGQKMSDEGDIRSDDEGEEEEEGFSDDDDHAKKQ